MSWYFSIVHPLPFNAITWSFGGLAMWMFAWKSWRVFWHSQNRMAYIYFWMGLIFGVAFFCFGLPPFWTADVDSLRTTYLLADFCVQLGMQTQVWLLWFIGLRNLLRLRTMLIVSGLISATSLAFEFATSHVDFSLHPYLVLYLDRPIVLILKSIIYVGIAVPLGIMFLRQFPQQTTLRTRLKVLMIGAFFIILCLAATYNNLVDHGSDTLASSRVVLALVVAFFIIQTLPRPKNTVRVV